METGKSGVFTLLLLVLIAVFTSCIPQKKLRYLQYDQAMQVADSMAAKAPTHRLAPHDILHVQVISAVTELNKVPGFDGMTNVGNDAAVFLQGYPIDAEGMIKLPLLGSHFVKGLTIAELQKKLTAIARETISLDAEVFIRLVNYKITVIGEVKMPGVIQVYDQRINILDAIAMSGDITTYGDRKSIMIVREKDDMKEIHFVDLTSRNVLNSPCFYLQNNDIVYVQALDAKTYGFGQVQWSIIVSSISTLIAILALVYK